MACVSDTKRYTKIRQVFRPVVLVVGLLILASGMVCAQSAASSDPRFDAARAVIRGVMQEKGIPSISVAVAKDGRVVWEEGFGWADREKMRPATSDTLYSLASISKPFTATGLMRLVEQGKLNLDKPANDYLGVGKIRGLAADASGATLRGLLSHTAGLPIHYQFFYEDEAYRPPSMDETITRYGILVAPPGERFVYSNLGFGILDHVIERVSLREFADYMRTEVFLPLGLVHTSVDIGPGLESFVAQRYDSEQRPIPFYTFDHVGGSAIYSSAHDLVRFGMFHLKDHIADQQAILKDSTIDQMQQQEVVVSDSSGYALGWFTRPNEHGYRSISHTGGMPGVSTSLVLFPSENLAVVVLCNKDEDLQEIRYAVAAAVLPKYAEALRNKAAEKPAEPKPFAPTPELLGEWVGTLQSWQGSIPFSLTFQADGDIHVKLGDELETLLNSVSFRDGYLSGRFAGSITTPDVKRYRHNVALNLRLRGGELNGAASAQTTDDPRHYVLSSYASLKRKTTDK
jgi:CubicO group peptidase (beta-lactamase class C family)